MCPFRLLRLGNHRPRTVAILLASREPFDHAVARPTGPSSQPERSRAQYALAYKAEPLPPQPTGNVISTPNVEPATTCAKR